MYNKLKKWFYRHLAKTRLVKRYEYLQEVNTLLEEYITAKILQGGSQEFLTRGREDLIKKQSEMKETESMLNFLRNVK